MPGTPIEENSNTLGKLQNGERPPNPNCEPVVRELTQTDKLNKRLLVSVLEKMNRSDGEFDKFMERANSSKESQEDSDF